MLVTIGIILLIRELYVEHKQLNATTSEECRYWGSKRWSK